MHNLSTQALKLFLEIRTEGSVVVNEKNKQFVDELLKLDAIFLADWGVILACESK